MKKAMKNIDKKCSTNNDYKTWKINKERKIVRRDSADNMQDKLIRK